MKKKKKKRVGRQILSAVILLLICALVFATVYVRRKLNLIQYDDGTVVDNTVDPDDSIFQDDIDITGLTVVREEEIVLPEIDPPTDDDVLNILLLGTDERSLEFTDAARSDAIMLVSLNFKEKTGRLISFERGMGVPILGGQYEGQYDWLTHCFRYGGADLMLKEIRECFNVDVDKYVRVNFNALILIVDAVGGVDLEFTDNEASYINYDKDNRYWIDDDHPIQRVTSGVNHVNGATALMYARCRHIDSDWHRIERQRNLVQAFTNELKGADVATLDKLLEEILPLVKTNFTQAELLNLMTKAPSMLGIQFAQMTIPVEGTYGGMTVMGGRGSFAPDFKKNAEILREFLYGPDA
ncbi:MAG: LCP family protein [Oscillospiraceae bacterium]|nr:LCP family protein [Oscillospiraceae bacterium]